MTDVLASAFDEDRRGDGLPRAGYDALLPALAGVDLAALQRAVAASLAAAEVRFGGEPFSADAIPRLLGAAEWDPLAAGLAQRARALNHFLHDAYGEQRIATEGRLAPSVIAEAEGFEPELAGSLPAAPAPAAIVGFDVVRGPDGCFLVLEDNARTPSGFAYALAVRAAVGAALPDTGLTPRPIEPAAWEQLGGALRAVAPSGARDPHVVVLTDGPGNVAYYEHAQVAVRLGATLAVPEDCDVSEGRLLVGSGSGRAPADVVYRRTDEDRIRNERGELTPVAAVLLEPWLAGRIGLVNAFGNGLADDKLIHGHVEDFIRFYLGEEPLIASVPRAELAGRDARALRELVVKPRHGHGGHGVVVGAHAGDEELERLAARLAEDASGHVAQPIVPLSRHPTIVAGRLEHRHIDLRAFAFVTGDRVAVMPGGLSRVALERGSLIVNSSQDGGGKDTWVLP